MRGKAEQFGVKEIYIDDLREEFVRDYVFPMFRCATVTHCCRQAVFVTSETCLQQSLFPRNCTQALLILLCFKL